MPTIIKHIPAILLTLFSLQCLAGGEVAALQWSTYFGGNGANQGDGVATDRWGNVYITGETTSTTNIATSGAYQTAFGGGSVAGDAFLAKFNPAGELLWATYFGGANDDGGLKVATDNNGNVFMTGVTSSATGVATAGAFQTTAGGAQDAFLAKFDSTGALLWATYFGGAGTDVGNGVATDDSGNVFLAGGTTSGGLATAGAYDTVYGGGNISGDGFLVKFNGAGAMQWATYFGDSGNDDIFGVATGDSGNVFITGFTTSTSGIATPGSYQPAYAGVPVNGSADYYNAFLAKFNSSGAVQWSTYFGGDSTTSGGGVTADHSGNIYFTGATNCPTGIATPGAHQTTWGGGNDAFIAKFNAAGTIQWSTYYGGTGDDQGFDITTNNTGSIFIVGPSGSITGIASPGAYQDSIGNSDFFLAQFDSTGNRLYATYYGVYDGSEAAVAASGNGSVYMGGVTTSATGMATTGAFDASFSGSDDAWLTKLELTTTTGISEVASAVQGIALFPDPVQNNITITSSAPIHQLTISNLLGENVYSDNYDNSNKVLINLISLPAGLYLVRTDNNQSSKFVKE